MIARGTGWDFVRTYGIPRRLGKAVGVALEGRTREIDVGRAVYRDSAGNEQSMYFANIASAGMSGAIARRANVTSKALGGKASYLWATIAVFSRWQSGELTVTVDGVERSARMHDVVVANGRYFGGGMKICPGAEPDDGLFDVLLIGDLTKRDLLLTLPKTYRGTHLPTPQGGGAARLERDRRGTERRSDRARRRAARNDARALRARAQGLEATGARLLGGALPRGRSAGG